VCRFVHHESYSHPGLNSRLCCEKKVPNRLSYGTA
jgi:hypothetical protein